jgi:stringent starvation protein B
MKATPASKEAVVLELLQEGDTMLCLDARCTGVRVPKAHRQNPRLQLVLNLNFPHPIEVTAQGIAANLAFAGRRFGCYVPMQALWAAFNPQTMQGMMWPDSMPPEVLTEMAAQQEQEGRKTPSAEIAPRPAKPRVSPGKEASAATDNKDRPAARQRGHLRVIK